jgi:ribosome maturation factor RimP
METERHDLHDEFAEILKGIGYCLVDLSSQRVHGRLHVNLVIYNKDGITIDDCAKVHKTLMPRLEVSMNDQDIALEVSSPGIERTMKKAHEFTCFTGHWVKVLKEGTWIEGELSAYEDQIVTLVTGEETMNIPVSEIQRAKLLYKDGER